MPDARRNASALIIGAGMTGILVAIKLREAGFTNVVLLEAKDRVGGTWRDNTYPGVACDVPSHAYTYEFEPNPEWSNLFADGNEIQGYFERIFSKYKLDEITRFNEGVTACRYEHGQWLVTTSKALTYRVDFLFSATGILRVPTKPQFPGMELFKGTLFHTAEWDHSIALNDKRIGYIGNGSTAAQAIPELARLPGVEVTVFQRTPQWILPVKGRAFTARERHLFRKFPALIRISRNVSTWAFAQMTTAITNDGLLDKLKHRFLSRQARNYLFKTVKDVQLREKLTPDYKFGCKRMIVNHTFYDAIQKPNVHLDTSGIDRFVENGIVSKDGRLHELDVVVLSTGFNPTAYMRPMDFTGKNALPIETAWQHKVQAYRSILIPDFPNFFLMLGPNTPIGNFSVIAMSEVQMKYILQLLEHWRAGSLGTIEVTSAALQQWSALLKINMGRTAWASGCKSWYLDADGDPLSWPDTWKKWLKVMDKPDLHDFVRS